MIIDHDPNEVPQPRFERRWYWASVGVIGLLWLGEWHYHDLSWRPLLLGLLTGAVLAAIAIEITGNKPPSSWGR